MEPIAGVFGLYVWNSIAGSVNSRHHAGLQTALLSGTLNTQRSLRHNDWMTSHYNVKCHLLFPLKYQYFSAQSPSALMQLSHHGTSLKFCCGCLSNQSQTATSTSLCLFSQQCSQLLLLQACFVLRSVLSPVRRLTSAMEEFLTFCQDGVHAPMCSGILSNITIIQRNKWTTMLQWHLIKLLYLMELDLLNFTHITWLGVWLYQKGYIAIWHNILHIMMTTADPQDMAATQSRWCLTMLYE